MTAGRAGGYLHEPLEFATAGGRGDDIAAGRRQIKRETAANRTRERHLTCRPWRVLWSDSGQ